MAAQQGANSSGGADLPADALGVFTGPSRGNLTREGTPPPPQARAPSMGMAPGPVVAGGIPFQPLGQFYSTHG